MIEEKKLNYEGVKGIPHIREPGNALRRNMGSWRVFKPKIDMKKCTKCKTCFTVCPDSAINWIKEKPKIDYDMCKGCLICVNECPVKAISAKRDLHGERK
jgi:2-oxoacid:acceptor oxidoreductase delta subunit (pyruvate/2-ketoisovalerate family)